jgi:hypothetical protein
VPGVVNVGAVAGRLGTGDPVLMGLMALGSIMPTGLSSVAHVIHFGFVALCNVMSHVAARLHYFLHITCSRRVSDVRVYMTRLAGMLMASAAIGNR